MLNKPNWNLKLKTTKRNNTMASNFVKGKNEHQVQEKRRVLEAMYFDVIHGKQKYQIREKFTAQAYDNKTHSDRQFFTYWNDMMDLFAEEFEKNREDLKSKFLARYLYLYEKAVDKKDLKGAKDILDSIVKLTGADEPIRQEIDVNGGFVIDFGLDNIVKDGEKDTI